MSAGFGPSLARATLARAALARAALARAALARAALARAALCLVPLTGCGKPLSQDECYDLLDKYVELLVQSDNPDIPPAVHLKLKAEARAKADRDPAFAECTDRVSRSEFECAMQAGNPDGLEQCLL